MGFLLDVGCALAVMHSIYMDGYRAAARETELPDKSKRYLEESAKVEKARREHRAG